MRDDVGSYPVILSEAATSETAPEQSAPSPDCTSPGNLPLHRFEPLQDRGLIVRVLQEIADSRSNLTLHLQTGQHEQQLCTSIFDVDAIPGAMLLYRIAFPDGQPMPPTPLPVDISCALPSGLFRFRGALAPFGNGISSACCLSIPTVLYRHQRRHSFRVRPPTDNNRIALPLAADVLDGTCLDLSLDGSCCVFTASQTGQLKTDDMIEKLNFELGKLLRFSTGAIVCRSESLESGELRLGLRFEPLPSAVQRQLHTGLNKLQRQLLRQQRHAGK